MTVCTRLLGLAALGLLVTLAGCKEESKPQGEQPKAGSGGGAAAAVDFVPGQIACPVMGNPIDKKFFTEYEGKRVYFCCKECIGQFKKDPQKYLAKLEAQRTGAVQPMPSGSHESMPMGEAGPATQPEQTPAESGHGEHTD